MLNLVRVVLVILPTTGMSTTGVSVELFYLIPFAHRREFREHSSLLLKTRLYSMLPPVTNTYSQRLRLSSILISRFILDLRGTDQSDGQMTSSMRFAAQVFASLGAPLDEGSVWVTNEMENVTDSVAHLDDTLEGSGAKVPGRQVSFSVTHNKC